MDIIVFNYFIIRCLSVFRQKIDNNDKENETTTSRFLDLLRSILMGAHTVNRQAELSRDIKRMKNISIDDSARQRVMGKDKKHKIK